MHRERRTEKAAICDAFVAEIAAAQVVAPRGKRPRPQQGGYP